MLYQNAKPPMTPPTAVCGAAVVAVGLDRLRGTAPTITPIVGSAD